MLVSSVLRRARLVEQHFSPRLLSSSNVDGFPLNFRNAGIPLKPTDPEEIYIPKPKFHGFDLAMYRSAAIVEGIAESVLSRVLMIHCDLRLVNHFSTVSNFLFNGISDEQNKVDEAVESKKFIKVAKTDFRDGIPPDFDQSFPFVTCLVPPERCDFPFPITTLLQCLNTQGFLIIGGTEKMWLENPQIMDDYKTIKTNGGQCSLYSRQAILCDNPLNPSTKTKYGVLLFRKEKDQPRRKNEQDA